MKHSDAGLSSTQLAGTSLQPGHCVLRGIARLADSRRLRRSWACPLLLALLCLAACVPPVSAQVPSVADAGFETPSVAGSYQYDPAGGPWTFSGAGITGNDSGFTYNNPSAPEGVQVAFLQGSGSVSQSVPGWQSGVSYTLTVAAAQRSGNAQTVQVQLDGQALGTISPAGSNYADYSVGPFMATAGTHTLAFVGLNPNGGDNTAFLDNVRLCGYDLAAPAGLTASAGDMQVSLSWSAVAGASGYNVYRSTSSGGPFVEVASGLTGTSDTDTGLADGTAYYYYVTAVDSVGESPDSNEVCGTPTLGTPVLSVSGVSNGSAQLSWTETPGSYGYFVYQATQSGGPYTQVFVGTGQFGSYTAGGLSSGVTYYWVVRAFNGGGSTYSNEVSGSFTLAAPVLSVSGVSNGSAQLSWTETPGCYGYRVYQATQSGGPYTQVFIGTGQFDSYTAGSLSNNVTYYWVVEAFYGSGNADSNEVSGTPTLAAPVLQATPPSGNTVGLSWTESPDADGYRVFRAIATGGPYTQIFLATGQFDSFTDYLSPNDVYYYVVQAFGGGGPSAYSNEVFGFIPPQTASTSLLLRPGTIQGGVSGSGLIVLSAPAPAGGEAFSLASGGPMASVPASVTVPAGASYATFTIATSAVSGTGPVTITATPAATAAGAGTALTATLTLLPPFAVTPDAAALDIAPGQTATSTIGINSAYGFTGPVALTLGGLPPGLTAWFYPPATTLDAPIPGASVSGTSSTLFLFYPPGVTVAAGPYALTVTGTSGATTSTSPLTLTVH